VGGYEVNRAMFLLQEHFGDVLALQCSRFGGYTPGKCMSRFRAANGRPFVQILNIRDNWILTSFFLFEACTESRLLNSARYFSFHQNRMRDDRDIS